MAGEAGTAWVGGARLIVGGDAAGADGAATRWTGAALIAERSGFRAAAFTGGAGVSAAGMAVEGLIAAGWAVADGWADGAKLED